MATVAEDKRMEVNSSPFTAIATYITSFGLVIGSMFDFMNSNALAFGVIFGAVTCWINYRAKTTMIKSFNDNGLRRRKSDFENE